MIGCCLRGLVFFCFVLLQQPFLFGREVLALVPAFNGGNLGTNVGTLLQLKIWRTLQIPADLSEGSRTEGKVLTSAKPLSDLSYETAENYARDLGAQVVVWGSIIEFGNAVIVQSLLAIPDESETPENPLLSWTVVVPVNDASFSISVSFPNRRYDLPPISLSRDLVESYADESSLVLYAAPDKTRPIGHLGHTYTRLSDRGDFSQVEAEGGVRGWVYLPNLNGDVPVVSLAAGLIRLFRHDFPGAIQLLDQVSKNQIPTSLKIDTLLLKAIALENAEKDPTAPIDAALQLNPHLRTTVEFKLVQLAWELKGSSPTGKHRAALEMSKVIKDYGYLFPPEDQMLSQARHILTALKVE